MVTFELQFLLFYQANLIGKFGFWDGHCVGSWRPTDQ